MTAEAFRSAWKTYSGLVLELTSLDLEEIVLALACPEQKFHKSGPPLPTGNTRAAVQPPERAVCERQR
jgi:hypothetical protein